MLPLFVFVLGAQAALTHAGLGLAGAIVLLEALMLNFDKVPFTCSYVPTENMKAFAPVYVIAFLIGASRFGRMESEALTSGNAVAALLTLALLFAILRVWSIKRARLPSVDFDESPATYQRLGLDR